MQKRNLITTFMLLGIAALWLFEYQSVEAKSEESAIENFDEVRDWNVFKPQETKLKLTTEKGLKGNCICLDYDLGEKKLYIVISKDFSIKLPQNYEFSFYVKGISPNNNLEFKLVDENENTYWETFEHFQFPNNWKKVAIKKSDISYAWGPKPGVELTEVKRIEFAISDGTGGKGKVYIDEMAITSLPLSPEAEDGVLKNPGFEKGLKHWEKKGNAKAIDCYSFHPHKGKLSFGIGNDDGPTQASGEISQNIQLPYEISAGEVFIFSMWMMGEGKYTGNAYLTLTFLGANHNLLKLCHSEIYGGRFNWKKATVSGKAPRGTRSIRVKCVSENMKTGQGASFVWFDNGNVDNPVVSASSFLEELYAPQNVIQKKGIWHSKHSDNQWIKVNFRRIKKFGGLFIDWDKDYTKNYAILISDDAKKWSSVYEVEKNSEGLDRIYLNETYAQFVKIECKKSSSGKGFGIKSIELKDPDEGITLKEYYEMVAKYSSAYFPRWLIKQQAYWTIVGVEGDENEAILCEDGTIEPHKRGFSIMPFLYLDGRPVTRSDAEIAQSLEKFYLPIPSVKWKYDNVEMNVKLFAFGEPGKSIVYAIYTIKSNKNEKVSGKLFLTVRPFQVYPPWQGGHDGFAPIYKINYVNNAIKINDKFRIFPLIKPTAFGSTSGSKGFKFPFRVPSPPELKSDISAFIKRGIIPEKRDIEDDEGFASCALEYEFELKPGKCEEFFIAISLHKTEPELNIKMQREKIKAKIEKMLGKRIAFWESKVDGVEIDIPERDLINAMKANIGFNLITKDGPALQPGSRSYDKAWMRDGSIQASSLLKMGLTEEARDFINWMARFQLNTGEMPPVIDNKAQDPLWEEKPPHNLKEFDSQGELIWSILEYYCFTNDKGFLESKWTNVIKALKFLEQLRKQRLTDEYNVDDPEKRRFYGILPPSRSHEGYWLAHSYWDDWWALKGWKDAKTIAEILGKNHSIRWMGNEYNDFLRCLCDSIKTTAKFKNVDYIPGCAEKGDFDPTSVAVAINYGGELENVEKYLKPYLKNTFDRYYKDIESRLKPGASYVFTPYEARNVPVFIYTGQKERALTLLRFLVKCCRPQNWYQLAEVVNSDVRNPCYIGDMPHTWVGAEFINGVRTLFVYEKDDSLILGAGIDEKWLERKQGVSVKNLPTYFGKISYMVKKEGDILKIKVSGKAKPEKGFVFKSPFLKKEIKEVKIDGKNWSNFSDNEVVFDKLPVKISITQIQR